jgi:nitroreductase
MSLEPSVLTIETIKKRISCRAYKHDPLTDSDRQKLKDFLSKNVGTPFGNSVRFELVDLGEKEHDEIKTLGTYGIIKGAKTFIAGAVSKGNLALEDFGYCMEKNILAATYLGLGTCWLGGTFDRSASASRINKRENEVVPAITPVGYPTDKKSIMDSTIRFFAKSNSRKGWEELFFDGDISSSLTRTAAGKYELPLDCVRIGPSASNKQPWRIIKEKGKEVCHFYLSRTPGYAEKYPGVSLQDIDMGIAMCHFEAAIRESNQSGHWKILPAPQQRVLEYIVSWVGEVTGEGPSVKTG